MSGARPWQEVPERTTPRTIRLIIFLLCLLGRRGADWLLWVFAGWFVAFHADVRRLSRAYLRRIGSPARLRDVFRHVLTFARVTADRVFLLRGESGRFQVFRQGGEELAELHRAGRGVILILAHVGSWEVLRLQSRQGGLPIAMLAYYENSRAVSGALRALDPSGETQLIEIRPGDPSFVFEVEERIGRGEIVGTMGDRVGADGKAVRVPFLGEDAAFPTGPYLLASAMRCPVFLAFGLFEAPDRYHVFYEPFAEAVALPRGPAREPALRELVARYAARLEHHCRAHPDNWFNFHDFWRTT